MATVVESRKAIEQTNETSLTVGGWLFLNEQNSGGFLNTGICVQVSSLDGVAGWIWHAAAYWWLDGLGVEGCPDLGCVCRRVLGCGGDGNLVIRDGPVSRDRKLQLVESGGGDPEYTSLRCGLSSWAAGFVSLVVGPSMECSKFWPWGNIYSFLGGLGYTGSFWPKGDFNLNRKRACLHLFWLDNFNKFLSECGMFG
ncbi:uncharacterized protein LOC126792222 [Argentina anserina]|uniref:uncharacterized protein LOC126792222 n=1 Tax=Argentina anserina TaxID=57926 RepID=UPI0021762A91|nr:uncharacterized protein LOC126792222 [Potentilla anserina]